MPLGPENSYPISDQNIRFSIPYFRPDSQNVHPISDPVMCGKFGNSEWILRRMGLRDAPNDVRVFFFVINVYGNTRYSKTGIPEQTDGIYTLFQTKMTKSIPYFRLGMLENDTLWGGTYLYGLYMGVHPPGCSDCHNHDTAFCRYTPPASRASSPFPSKITNSDCTHL